MLFPFLFHFLRLPLLSHACPYPWWVGEPLEGFQNVVFLPSRTSFPPHFIKIVVELNTLGLPHVLKQLLGESKGILPVKYFCSNKAFFVSVEFHGDHMTVTKLS